MQGGHPRFAQLQVQGLHDHECKSTQQPRARVRIGRHLDAAAVVQAKHGRHEVAERVVAEVGADVGDAEALAGRQALRHGVRQPRHAEPRRRLQTTVRIPACGGNLSGRRMTHLFDPMTS